MEQGAFYRYVMTFTKTTDTMQSAKKAVALFPSVNVMPVPNQISKSCGLALEFPRWEPDAQRCFYDALTVPAHLYRLTLLPTQNGANRIVCVKEMPRNQPLAVFVDEKGE